MGNKAQRTALGKETELGNVEIVKEKELMR